MENTIRHHGIRGMKWGVRRYQNRDGSLTPEGKKRYSDGVTSHVKSMSDQELRDRINRLQLEKQYKSLLEPEGQKKVNKGKAFVQNVLETSGKNIATQLTTYAMGTLVNKYIGKGKQLVNPKKGQKDK